MTAMPFGKHRGRDVATVPTPYLDWLLRTCKLTPNVKGAVRAELLSRGADPASLRPEPAASPPPRCRGCGGDDLSLSWQGIGKRGARAIRAGCRRCRAFVYFAPQTPENIALADAAEADAADPEPPPAGEEFDLRIRSLPGAHAPAVVRLRHVLKGLLRAYNFRALSVRAVAAAMNRSAESAPRDGPDGNHQPRTETNA